MLITWTHTSPTNMASFTHNVAELLTDNADTFPSPTVTPKDGDTAATELELAYAKRLNGALAKTKYEQADENVDNILHDWADYVSKIANGDKAVIELAGFTATSTENVSAVVPATPNAARITGNAAALTVATDVVKGATSYCWLIFTDAPVAAAAGDNYIKLGAAPVIVIPNGHLRETLHNIIPAGTKISVQVLGQNAAGKSGFSAMVSITVGG